MHKTKKYQNPPLIESVFELFFESENWNPLTNKEFYNEIKAAYPQIKEANVGMNIALNNVKLDKVRNNLIRFTNQDQSSIIQLSNNCLTVNKLPPYLGWESYKNMIIEALNALNKVCDITNISRIGLKSLNKIDIQEHSYNNIKSNFNIFPNIPEDLNSNMNAMQFTFETSLENSNILATSLMTARQDKTSKAPVIFQLYITKLNEIKYNDIDSWLEFAHSKLHNSFEGSITQYCKEKFDKNA